MVMGPPQGYVASSVIPQELWYNVRDFGAPGNGTTEEATILQNTINAIPATGGVLYIPDGDHLVSSAPTWKSNITVVGGNISHNLILNYNGTLFDLTGLNNVNVQGVQITGQGAGISGTSAAAFKFSNTHDCFIDHVKASLLRNGLGINILAGCYGLNFHDAYMIASQPLYSATTTGPTRFVHCKLINPGGLYVTPANIAAILLDGGHGQHVFTSCELGCAVAAATTVATYGSYATFNECYIGDAGTGATTGIRFDNASTYGEVSGGILFGFATGMLMRGTHIRVNRARFLSCTTPITADAGSDNIVSYCPGYNPQGFSTSTPAVPATGVDQTNANPYAVRIYFLTSGTATSYMITDPLAGTQTITTALAAGNEISLDPGAKIRITYTVAPTWKWYGE